MRGSLDPANRPWNGGGFTGENGGGGPIPKKAGTDEHPGVIIQVRGRGADFHADHEGMAG